MNTASTAAPISGDKLYQQRAREALPLLVRQAWAATSITYSDLAAELGMPNPRNLNYVLGCIGQTLLQLSRGHARPVPPIQCLVINKSTGLPGEGVGWFLTVDKDEFATLNRTQQQRIVEAELQRVYAFPHWRKVLTDLNLEPVQPPATTTPLVHAAAGFRGGGESEHHRRLKEHVVANPILLGLPADAVGTTEYGLPSGDAVDVMFICGPEWIAVEVKSRISDEPDLVRGLFQCVKYRAVCRAQQAILGKEPDARAVLVIEGTLPRALLSMKNTLGVEVVENVRPVASKFGIEGAL